jgi:hypothetical protein
MEPPVIAILETNRVAAARMARVLSVSSGRPVQTFDDPLELATRVGFVLELLVCDARELEFARRLLGSRCPTAHCLLLAQSCSPELMDVLADDERFSHLLAWPEHLSTPRVWELAQLGARLVGQRGEPPVASALAWGHAQRTWTPRTTRERDVVVAEAVDWLIEQGTSERAARRVSETTYELVMNAMYDAPLTIDGSPRFAFDRTREIELHETEAPRVTLASDGVFVVVDVTDPFGALRREHVFAGIARGLRGQESTETNAVLDTSHGGAGLGMVRVFTHGAATSFTVVPGVSTRVTSVIDIDANPRDARRATGSVSFYWGVS